MDEVTGDADACDSDCTNESRDKQDEPLASLRLLQDDGVFRAGAIPRVAIAYWADAVTDVIVITGKQRNQHYLLRHPEMYADEARLLQALIDP